MSVEAVATRADEKILPVGVEIFFRLLVLPLGLCFCEQSGGMTKTALPIRFKPALVVFCCIRYLFTIKVRFILFKFIGQRSMIRQFPPSTLNSIALRFLRFVVVS